MSEIDDQDIDPAEMFEDIGNKLLDRRTIRNVSLQREHALRARLYELFARGTQTLVVASANRHRTSCLRQLHRTAEAKPFARGGNQRNLAIKSEVHRSDSQEIRARPFASTRVATAKSAISIASSG